MKKIFGIISSIIILGLVFIIYIEYQQIQKLKQENHIVNNINVDNVINKPDIVYIIISWVGGTLSRQTDTVGTQTYYNPTLGNEVYPINSEDVAKEFISYRFNGGGYGLIASCNEGYKMTTCEPFSEIDYVENQGTQCFLGNEDPNLLRTSMNIECTKI